MRFISTRGGETVGCAAEAIAKGLATDGGLFVPESFPDLSGNLSDFLDMSYPETAAFVLKQFLPEYDEAKLLSAARSAYLKFDSDDTVPLVKIDDGLFILELFHGPTLAFKDVALTLLPHLLREGCDIAGKTEEVLILVATSGDTGKAALEGFAGQKGIKIMVFFPNEGVSEMQKRQMQTQEGDNVSVVSVKGNFDDCQTAVKTIFADQEFNEELKKRGVILSSANSINFGRLAPQIAYYFSAYSDLVNAKEIALGDEVDFCVPTGNFGNILAGYYAKRMGLPVGKLICASNENNVLTDFFATGTYDANRPFYKTGSPSMDILISSNLERLIFELTGRNTDLTKERMTDLKTGRTFSVSDLERKKMQKLFGYGYTDEKNCANEIRTFFDEYGYTLDPHTAVAAAVAERNIGEAPMVVLSTASPYKFPSYVYGAITGKNDDDAFQAARKLEYASAEPIPTQISSLKEKPLRFTKVVNREEIQQSVLDFISKV